jgi:hypothetical protein
MKRALESWTVVCVAESAAVAWTLAQVRIAEAMHWTTATVEQARSWASVANDSANDYAARLVAAAAELSPFKYP